MPYANISAELTAAQITAITGAINTIKTNLPFLLNLSKEERSRLSKMGPNGYSYVTKAIDYANGNASALPAVLNVVEAKKDLKLYNDMRPLAQAVAQLIESMDDTMMALGVEAKDFSDTFYGVVQGLAKANVPGMDTIADDLGVFYEKARTEDTPPTP